MAVGNPFFSQEPEVRLSSVVLLMLQVFDITDTDTLILSIG